MEQNDFCVAIVRLSPFRDVVKSITHQFLYGECVKAVKDEAIDFFFLPTESERKHKKPLTGLRSGKPLADFDLIFISNSFTSEMVNLAWMLKHSGIPYSSLQREKSGTKPIIVMGGSNAMASQALLFSNNEALVDAIFFGEGENQMQKIVSKMAETPLLERRKALSSMQGELSGLKVFSAPEMTIKKSIYHEPKAEILANAPQFLFDSSEAANARLFIAYDCPSFCTFCFEGWERKPYREISGDTLLESAKNLRLKTGADTLEITAFNFNTHTDVTKLMTGLSKMFFNVNFMSQRADILAENPSLVHYEVAAGKRQHTIGVEGISERMRTYFNKNLSEETLLKTISLLFKESIREVKLFYIISGLETEDDNKDYIAFLQKIAALKQNLGVNTRILCSFGLLVRMPFTPLRYEKLMLTREEWEPIVQMIKQSTEAAGYEFRLTYDYDEFFLSQALCMTNEFCGQTLVDMAEKGFIYDMGISKEAWKLFQEQHPVTKEFTDEKSKDYKFAYSFIDTGISDSFLYKRFQDAKNNVQSKMCLSNGCSGCGSCTNQERKNLCEHVIKVPTLKDTEEIAALVKAKAQARPVYIEVNVSQEISAFHPETIRSLVMKEILNKIPDGVHKIMTAKDALFGSKDFEDKISRWYGKTVYAVYPFDNAKQGELLMDLKKAGFNVQLQCIQPKDITITLTRENPTPAQEMEKLAARLMDSMHMPYTLSRKDGFSNFLIAPKALKKKVVQSCSSSARQIVLKGSMKMDISEIRKNNFTACFQWN